MNRLKIEYAEVKDLILNPKNPRRNEPVVDKMIKSIESFGWTNPILVRKANNVVIAGHTRLKAAQKMKLKKVPVVFLDLDEGNADAYMITDNKMTELAEWDNELLAELFSELEKFDIDIDLTGFDEEDVESIIFDNKEIPQGLTDDDEVPDKPKKAKTKKGDLYLLGNHRLLCGDSTKKEDVEKLMDGKKADMVFTDPPYGAKITGFMQDVHAVNRSRHWDMIEGDQFENEELQQFLEKAFKNASISSKENAAWYVWHAMMTQGFFAAAAAAANLILNRQIIWVKPCLILAFGHYHWRHELCFYGWKKGNMPKFYGQKNETTVWEIDFDGKGRMPKDERKHPTQKPTALAERAIKNSSLSKQIVLDLFLGSGTTLIACEKLSRICYGMEIDPLYCDVIVQRWQNFTGKTAKLISGKKKKAGKRKRSKK